MPTIFIFGRQFIGIIGAYHGHIGVFNLCYELGARKLEEAMIDASSGAISIF